MSKKSFLKKTLAVSTAAVLSTALLNFGPVSYKVFDNSASVVHASQAPTADVDQVKALIQAVLNELNGEAQLKAAYDAAITESQTALSSLDILGSSTYLAGKVKNPVAVEAAVLDVMREALKHSQQTDISTIPATFSAAVSTLNSELGTTITSSDIASFLLMAQEEVIYQLQANPLTILTSFNLLTTLIDAAKEVMDSEWSSSSNEVVKQLQDIYGSDVEALVEIKSDLTLLKNALLAEADTAVLEKGGQALALGYIKQQLNTTPGAIVAAQDGNTYTISAIKVGGSESLGKLLAGQLVWSTTAGTATYNAADSKIVLDVTNVTKPVEVTLTGKISGFGFTDITLISKKVKFEAGTVSPPITPPVTSPAPIVPISPPDTSKPIVVSPDITPGNIKSNTEQQAALSDINKQLAEKFVVDLKDFSTTVGQLTTVNLTLANFDEDFFNAYKTIIKNAKEKALEATGSDKIKPVITFNLGSNNDGKVNISNEVISKMKDAGLYALKLSTNEASVEVPLADLSATATVSLTSAAASEDLNISGVQSKVYSIDVSEGGTVIPHSEQQYKVTIPVAAGADPSKLTVAKLVNGSITYVGGKYDAATNTIVFYSNEPGSFVAVEHEVSFADGNRYDWATDAIQKGAVHGILLGKASNEFKPEDSVTRAEFVAVLLRALNLTASTDAIASITFKDVPAEAWYRNYIAAAAQYGITNGRSPQQFDPNATITREEMASLIANAMKNVLDFAADFSPSSIFDQDGDLISPVHTKNVDFVSNEGIMQGTGEGQFDPKKDVSRAEASVIAIRLLEKR